MPAQAASIPSSSCPRRRASMDVYGPCEKEPTSMGPRVRGDDGEWVTS